MKKVLVVLVFSIVIAAIVVGFSGCAYDSMAMSAQDNLETTIQKTEDSGKEFVHVSRNLGDNISVDILLDVNNGVQYIYVPRNGLTAMVDENGKPIINETWKEMHQSAE